MIFKDFLIFVKPSFQRDKKIFSSGQELSPRRSSAFIAGPLALGINRKGEKGIYDAPQSIAYYGCAQPKNSALQTSEP